MADLDEDGDIGADGDFDFKFAGPLTDLTITGDFGGGTIKLQKINTSTGAAGDAQGGTFTGPFTTVLESDTKHRGRINLSGSTDPDINVQIAKVSR